MSFSKRIVTLIATIALLLMSGCSGLHPYKNNLDRNLTVTTKTDSGSFFTSLKARVDIYTVDDTCKLAYQGTVDLKNTETDIGLSTQSPHLLDFVFSSSTFLGSTKGATSFDTYFTPRSGYKYAAEARYVDGIYDVTLNEKKIGSKKGKELPYGKCSPK